MALAGTKALEVWCKRITTGYANVNILNMTTSWRSGLGFCAIIHHHSPELLDFNSLDPDDIFGNNSLAFSVAEQQLGIPSLLDPQDMVECELLDRLSILTYLAQYFQAFNSQNAVKANIRRNGSISNSSTSSDLTDAAKLQMKNPMIGRLSDPCKQCGKSVFILERLNVGGRILHRTCFKCARCQDQLTLASFYETETGQFCCEVCPDEETKERERTLRVNKDLAKLMAGDSGNSEEEDMSDTDGSIMSGVVGEITEKKDEEVISFNSIKGEDVNSNETGIVFTVNVDSLEKKIEHLELESSEKKTDMCDNDAFIENTEELETNTNELHFNVNNNNEVDIKEVENSQEVAENCDEVDSLREVNSICLEEIKHYTDIVDEHNEDSELYPEDKNPFGDEDECEEPPTNIQSDVFKQCDPIITSSIIESSNPFGSDLDSDEDDVKVQARITPCNTLGSSSISNTQLSSSLNPFGSDLSSDEEAPRARPSVSPTPSTRSTIISKKKRPAPMPPSHITPIPAPRLSLQNSSRSSSPGSTFQRKAKAAPDPPAETAKRLKDADNLNRRSQILEGIRNTTSPTPTQTSITIPEHSTDLSIEAVTSVRLQEEEPNKAEEGQWRKKKGPAPPRPIPPKRTVRKLARKAINQELFDIEVKQGGLERQGVKLEKTIREICAASDAEEGADRDSLGPEAEDLIIQLFDLVNEKNDLFRRQTELIYMKKENRLEEMHADCEYQIRVLMSKPECQRTDDDKMSEEKLIAKLVEIVTQRNEIVDCLEMDRVRELDEDTAIEDHMSNYAAVKPAELPKKGLNKILKRKKKKKDKDKDDEKDVDTSEMKDSSVEKPKKKSARKKLISLASKKLSFPPKK